MPSAVALSKVQKVKMFLPEPQRQCTCHKNDPPPWTGEIHGLSQALMSDTVPMRAFWWVIMVTCISFGITTTCLVIIEYIKGPTATSTTIRLVESLELPAITICPKVPDAFNQSGIMGDIKSSFPEIDDATSMDLVRYFIAGSGLENMDDVVFYNRTYLSYLNNLYKVWSEGFSVEEFFDIIQSRYGYKCGDLFASCELAGKTMDCCNDLMIRQVVMRRGICYQTRVWVNQTEADDIGRIVFHLYAPSSVTNPDYNFTQPQLIVYITDNHNFITDFPRFYLYPHEWNRMRFTARYIELIRSKDVCTNQIFGKDAECQVRKWVLSNWVIPFNCTLPYLPKLSKMPPTNGICRPDIVADNYFNNIQLVFNSPDITDEKGTVPTCMPGCKRWDYQTSLQQSQTLSPFPDYVFNLEASFNDLQYEYVKEVYTTSVPGFMSQIGGQFGFFLGLSIITLLQMLLYGVHAVFTFIHRQFRKRFPQAKIYPAKHAKENGVALSRLDSIYPPEIEDRNDQIATLSRKVLETYTSPPSPVSTIIDSVDIPHNWGALNLNKLRVNPLYEEQNTSL